MPSAVAQSNDFAITVVQKVREESFSLRENHERLFRFGIHQLRNRYSRGSPTTLIVDSHSAKCGLRKDRRNVTLFQSPYWVSKRPACPPPLNLSRSCLPKVLGPPFHETRNAATETEGYQL